MNKKVKTILIKKICNKKNEDVKQIADVAIEKPIE